MRKSLFITVSTGTKKTDRSTLKLTLTFFWSIVKASIRLSRAKSVKCAPPCSRVLLYPTQFSIIFAYIRLQKWKKQNNNNGANAIVVPSRLCHLHKYRKDYFVWKCWRETTFSQTKNWPTLRTNERFAALTRSAIVASNVEFVFEFLPFPFSFGNPRPHPRFEQLWTDRFTLSPACQSLNVEWDKTLKIDKKFSYYRKNSM